MPRTARIICPGIAHHVTQRGNRQQEIFLDEEDRKTYLRLLGLYAGGESLHIVGYCLMTNHLHLIVIPRYEDSLAKTIQRGHLRYAQYMNGKYSWRGHLFASHYYSCPLDESHLWSAMRYVERNPVRARMVKRPEGWPWSSAATHCGRLLDPLLDMSLMKDWPPKAWRKWLTEAEPDDERELRLATRTGRPCGSAGFVRKLERLLGRKLERRPRGRPATKQ